MTVCLNLLLHQHQPDYRPADGGPAVLPWVRLHAVRGYNDLLSVLERCDQPACCVNFSGILLEQLAAQVGRFSQGLLAVDQWAALSLKPASDWSDEERRFAFVHFFSANHQNLIRPHARYWELLQTKLSLEAQLGPGQGSQEFSTQDFSDLAAWFNLAWIGFSGQRSRAVEALIRQGQGFTAEQNAEILTHHGEILGTILPRYRALQDSDKIELSVTPYQHPILPLLCDLQGCGSSNNADQLPEFQRPEDAREHVRRGKELYELHFGRPAEGMWPAEGSVSDAALAILAECGLHWCATDQANLPRPENSSLAHLSPRQWEQDGRQLAVFFRDTRLSDNIGFVYSSWNPREAVDHFLEMLGALGRASASPEPVVTVALDGENPWENYADGGEGFLLGLFQRLATSESVRAVTPSQLLGEQDLPRLSHVHAGSWINGNFDIWSRHAETRQAWRLLARARTELGGEISNPAVLNFLLAAEGSDWFWWYGDDFVATGQEIFDELFRGKLRAAYELAGRPAPLELDQPICTAYLAAQLPEPEALLEVSVDGRLSFWSEWLDAFKAGSGSMQGAMALSSDSAVLCLYYGFSADALVLRLDLAPELLYRARDGQVELGVNLEQGGRELRLLARRLDLDSSASQEDSQNTAEASEPTLGYAAEDFLELAIPLADTGFSAGQPLWLWLDLSVQGGQPLRFPPASRIGIRLPAADFKLRHWSV